MALFTEHASEQLQQICLLMMEMNSHVRQKHANQGCLQAPHLIGTYGYLHLAAFKFAEIEVGIRLGDARINDPNWGGGLDLAADLEDYIERTIDWNLNLDNNERNKPEVEHIRTYKDSDYRLELYDCNDRVENKHRLAYKLYFRDELTFWGDQFYCSPLHAVDSNNTLAALFSLLGTIDPEEHGATYTPAQREFLDMYAEDMWIISHDLEGTERGEDDE